MPDNVHLTEFSRILAYNPLLPTWTLNCIFNKRLILNQNHYIRSLNVRKIGVFFKFY
ncbi:hypothetical protein BDE27_0868 [Xenorhabdus ehlersii]|uniref:Uncharacterized protein n=1 Tax=Xenorhabdus ehlersii TaxID=290111 RepID=A0A2D0IXJ6_9GAMM|nr:hypothetical protein Xehl_00304 [Xenorhabdus ehlersii]RKE93158.1 hypothetical protein BDE27_0868 [Xenorhabdus ehlersii]